MGSGRKVQTEGSLLHLESVLDNTHSPFEEIPKLNALCLSHTNPVKRIITSEKKKPKKQGKIRMKNWCSDCFFQHPVFSKNKITGTIITSTTTDTDTTAALFLLPERIKKLLHTVPVSYPLPFVSHRQPPHFSILSCTKSPLHSPSLLTMTKV